jgi:hypothetical protein
MPKSGIMAFLFLIEAAIRHFVFLANAEHTLKIM